MLSTWNDNAALEDPTCDPRLLPTYLQTKDNSARVNQYKKAIRKANLICLNAEQRQQIQLYYGRGLSKQAIARRQGKSWSAVSRSMAAAEQAVKEYVELYMEIYDDLARQRSHLEQEDNW